MTLASGFAQTSLSVYQPNGVAATPDMLLVSTPFCSPGNLVSPPLNLSRQILRYNPSGGPPTIFSDLSTLPNGNIACSSDGTAGFGSYMAIAPGTGGFTAGVVYVLLGNNIYTIPATGGTPTLFVKMPQTTHGLVFDQVGTFGYNLVVVTRSGNISSTFYTVTSAGKISPPFGTIATVVEGPAIAPYNYGIIVKGDVVSAGEDGNVYDVTPAGTVKIFASGFNFPGSVDFIPQQVCKYYSAVLGPYPINQENQLNPSPSVVDIYDPSFFAGHNGLMMVRDEGFVPAHQTGPNISVVDTAGVKLVIGTAPGEQEQGQFLTTCVALGCPSTTGQLGVPYSSPLTARDGVPPYKYSITAGALPPGLTLNASTGVISGTPTALGSFTFTAQAVDSTGSAGGTTTATCNITITPAPLLLTCPTATGQVGAAYSSALSAAGGVAPYTFSISSGSLPPGLSLNASTGAITGTPTAYGTFAFTAQVADSNKTAATSNCTIVIAPALVTLTCPTATAQVGVTYSSALTPTGGIPPYTFSILTGALPPGLSLNASTGAITGLPTKSGTFAFTAKVVDSTGTQLGSASVSCSIVVSPSSLALTCPTATAQVGVAYSSALTATGGVPPYSFSISSGSLPGGLTLDPSTGAITGTPTDNGVFSFTGRVTDSIGTAVTSRCTIVVSPATLTLTCPTATGQVGAAYSSALTPAGGVAPYAFLITSGSLPPGLKLTAATGAITGTPTTYGTFSFTAQVKDSTGTTTTSNCSIVIAPATLTLTCPTATGKVGVVYSSALTATGGAPPYTFSITSGSLPTGLSLNASTGAITGTPTTFGTFAFTAKVADSTGTTTTSDCTIVIAPAPVVLTCPTATAQVGVAYSSALTATGGEPPYTFSIIAGALPTGLTLDAATGAITGLPTKSGTFNFTGKAVDSTGTIAGSASANCSIVVSQSSLALNCPTATAQVGVAYSSALAATGGVPPYSFSISSGSLPGGLTLDPSTGAITGTPTANGTFTFTGKVTDSIGTVITKSCSIVVSPATLVLTCPTATGQVGVSYSSALTATGGIPAYTFSITSGSLPPGLKLTASTGAITGTPTTYGTFSFTAQVKDSTGTTTTSDCSIVIAPAPIVLTCPTATGQVGVAYSSALTATGGEPPYTFSISGGSLPGGLTLDPATGAITGTPTANGTFTFTGKVTDSIGAVVTKSCSIVVSPATLVLTCPTATGQVGAAYSSALTATGGVSPYTFSITSGSLPPGLKLTASTGAITGTPTTYGTFSFTAQVADSKGTKTTSNCTIVIAPAPLVLTCPTATGKVGVAYSSALTVTGGVPPYTYSITSGSLPPGLTLNASTGAITGTPTTFGTFTFTAQVADSTGTKSTADCSIVIAPAPVVLTCPTATAQVGVSYSSALTATGGEPPYTFSIIAGALPTGLSLDPSTGAITGLPTKSGTFNFTAKAVDSTGTTAGSASANCSIVVSASSLALTCPTATAQVGVAYSSTLAATGGVPPYSFSISSGSLPGGLSLDPSTGAITGTPTANGTFTFTGKVTDSIGTVVTKSCSIVVSPATLVLNCPTATGQVGVSYSSALTATGGIPAYTFSITTGSLPSGLRLNASTGAITGTPTAYGTFSFTAQVKDSTGTTTTSNCSIVIAPAPIVLTCPTATGQVGVAYSSALTATGGEPPYTFSISGGSLPGGLTLDPATGAITGTPTANGTFSFTGKVTDSIGAVVTKSCSIVVSPATLGLTCPTATGQVGVAYSSALTATGGVSPYTFSITSGSLPPGLKLTASTGAITGTPTTFGTFSFTAQVADSTGTKSTADCSIVIAPAPVVLTCPTASAQVGVTYSSALTATGGEPPYTFSIIAGALPTGLSLDPSTGAITGLPTRSGTFNFTAKAVDSTGTTAGSASANCTIVVSASGLALTCPTATAQVGVAYSSALAATSGVPPYSFSISSGSLPGGLVLNASTGAITGTPTANGTFTFTGKVTDSIGTVVTKSCSIVVSPATLVLTCPTATGQVGVSYSSALTATGGIPAYTFSITSGSLPPGLKLTASTGAITGTPTTYGTFSFTAQVKDSTGTTTTSDCSIVIAPAPVVFTCPTATGQVGVTYSSALTASGGEPPYTFSITAGALPTGLSLNATSGAITGLPTKSGTFTFTAKVVDSTGTTAGTASRTCSIVISASSLALNCPTATAQVGIAYSSALTATGGVPPYSFSISSGSLPGGLTLDPSTGAITGTPTANGTFTFTGKVTDSIDTVITKSCTIVVSPATLTLNCPTATGQVGVSYSSALTATGGIPAYTFSITSGSLPPGFKLTASTGAITGTPATYGTFSFTAQVKDSTGTTTTHDCSIVIDPAPIVLTCPTATGQVGVAYSSALTATGGETPYTFSISSGSLPGGLTLDPATGAITGTPTANGTFSFTGKVTDAIGAVVTKSCSIVVSPATLVLTCPTATGQVGAAYSSSLTATGGVSPYTFSITSGSLPPGLKLTASTGAITGTPTTYGTFSFTAQVADSTRKTATSNCTIVIAPAPMVLTCPTATGKVGVVYSSALTVTGGVPPYAYSITSGSLPQGLTLNASTGAITGTPTTFGTFTFTGQAADSTQTVATSNCTIVIAPAPVVLTCPTATAQVGVAYSSALTATGGEPPYTFSIIAGALPTGLTLDASTGAITGLPTKSGTFNFTGKAVDSTGTLAGSASSNCSIVVAASSLALTCPTATAQVGVAYSSALAATGGVSPYSFSVSSGSLPGGLTLDPSTGAITGTPTANGTFTFTGKVTDSIGTVVTKSCSIVVSPATLVLACPTATGQVGVAYSSALTATGGVSPYTFSITSGSLPPGLKLTASTGAITGTPTAYGTFSFTTQVKDSTGTATTSDCSIVIAPAPVVFTCPTATGQVGVAYSSALTASGGEPPYAFSITGGALPLGLSLDASSGAVTGLPTKSGTFTFTAKVVDSTGTTAGTASRTCSIVISASSLALTCPAATAQVGIVYSSALTATGGVPPYSFSISSGSLPAGLTLDASTGAITGTPTASGTFSVTGKVTDSIGTVVTTKCTITVAPSNLALTCPTPSGQVGVAYSSALAATGGVAPYSFSITNGALPGGLTLDAATGAITGTPTTYGTFSFTAKVVDSIATAVTSRCTIIIAPPTLTLACPTATAQVGVAYSSALTATGGAPPYTFSISTGSLPTGLTMDASSGAITGTPTASGTFTFTGKVVDSLGKPVTSNCTIVVAKSSLALTCPTATAQVGVSYSSALAATGGVSPYTFSISTGTLPAGLTLDTSTGAITGTPTMAGTFNFTAKVVDAIGTAVTSNCTITVSKSSLALTCPTATAQLGVAYSSAFIASGGVAPYKFSIATGSLPAGLTLDAATGAITGTPTTFGSFSFTGKVTDSIGTVFTVNCNIAVQPATLTLTCPAGTGQVGVGYSSTFTATGGASPYRFSITSGSLPPGLTLNAVTGALIGKPTMYGTFAFTAKVLDSMGASITTDCSIVIAPVNLSLACPGGTGSVGQEYASSLTASGGVPPYTFAIANGVLPPGLSLDTSSGAITGVPTAPGTFNFVAQVTDSVGTTITANCSIAITGIVVITCPAGSGQVGVPYSSPVGVSGGKPPYTFSITAGSLPPGLTLGFPAGSKVLSVVGTPTKYGVFDFTLQAVDSSTPSNTGVSSCTIVILPPTLTLACPNAGEVGAPYMSGLQAMGGVPPYTFSITAGTLPPGLKLNPNTGVITGTPTIAGMYSVTFQVVDSSRLPQGTVTRTCDFIIAPKNVLSNCLPTSSMSVLAHGKSVVAYIPNGSWSEDTTGVQYVTIEASPGSASTGGRATISTPAPVNSCSSNWATGQTVCTGNGTDVYVINNTTLASTLNDNGFGYQNFTGGSCTTCGVAFNAATNQAVVATSAGNGPGAVQFLDMATKTFGDLIVFPGGTSEDIAIDPIRNLVLSPNEGSVTGQTDYNLLQFSPTLQLFNFADASVFFGGGGEGGNAELDSAAEDCSTGIALSTDEFTGSLFITDLTQVTFDPAAGTWTAPSQLQTLQGFENLAAGTSGIAVAAGSHLAIVTGEFCCGGLFGAIQLPSNAGVGTPAIEDWVSANLPNDPSGVAWQNGLDPHTVTAYSSPNNHRAYGVMANDARTYLAIIDLQALLNAPRITGSHFVNPNLNLVTTGIVRWVSIPPPSLSCPTSAWDQNAPYSSAFATVAVTPPLTFSITGDLPPGLVLDPSSGSITGTPTTTGTYSFTGMVTDSAATTLTKDCSIAITAGPGVTCPAATGSAGMPYSSTTAVPGGAPPFSYSITSGALPPGLSLDGSTGNITGSPTVAGTYTFTVTVYDGVGESASTDNCTITIAPPTLTVVAPPATGQVSIAYFAQVVTGGTAPYAVSITAGSLPPGLNTTSSGTLTGTPTATGTYSFTMQATDSVKGEASLDAAITIGTVDPNILASCQTASSMSVLAQGSTVKAYVPNGAWGEYNSGIQLVPIEGSGAALSTISTSSPVNSCASNWATGQTVCTGNNDEVLLISGSSITNTLTAGGFGQEYFSGGQCETCGVAIDASTNQAAIEVATNYGSGGVQLLDLNTNTFGTPIAFPGESAENIGVDPFHHLVLSPNEGIYGPPDYSILQTQPVNTRFSFASIFNFFGYYDYLASGAEDCSTGIALATEENYPNLFVTDLTQATFDPVTLTWNAPAQVQYMSEFYSLSDGASGIAIAGQSHLGVVTGEFCCGSGFAAIQMPATSGSGTPGLADYVVAYFPNDPSFGFWQNSQDPHRVTAYVSPNSGKAYGLVGNDQRSYLALIDLQALLAAPRQPGSHYIDGSVDLVGSGILKWIPASVPSVSCPYPNQWVTGAAYSATVTAYGGLPPYTFSISGGSLPTGLTMDASGNITGTPTATGTFNFTVQVVDSTGTAGGTGSINCSITIAVPLALTAPAGAGQAGAPYSSSVGITGGFPPYNLYLSAGSLPLGLTLNGDATITGTPTLAGVYNFSIYVYDQAGTSTTGDFTIMIAPAALVTSCPLTKAQSGWAYFSQAVSGGTPPYNVSITSGSLPPGLTAYSSGLISGTPTANGTYSFGIQVTDSAGLMGSAGSCSIQVVTPQPAGLSSCQPANSLSVLAQSTNVNAYFPAGSWDEYINNIYVVPLEGSGSRATISTTTPVNSCASNWINGQTVCTDNYSGVYRITGSTVNQTLTSGAFGYNYTSEGSCTNCGATIDPAANKAVLTEALGFSYPGGFQFLDLATSTFETAVAFNSVVSPGALVDPVRHMILFPTEGYGYLIYQTQPAAAVFNFANTSFNLPYYNGSAAEDCTTGIILSTNEYDETFFIADLSQGVFDPISGAWNAANQVQYLPELSYSLANGPTGIAIAQGSHLGLVTGAFCCGGGFGAIQLPATSGAGTPAIADWVEANLPNNPSGNSWQNGLGPHTLTAYVSPNTGKALGVIGNDSRTYIALIDLQALLSALRQEGTHYLDPSVDLVASGILTWVSVQ